MMRNMVIAGALLATVGVGLSQQAIVQGEQRARSAPHANAQAPAAKATLQDVKGKTVGQVMLWETAAGVLIRADLTGVPAGTHGFHLHEVGECTAPTFESAGGHLNPDGKKHGLLAEGGPHAGDIPNLHVPARGRFSVEILNTRVTLGAGAQSLMDNDGSAVVVHAGEDDYRTDPAGEAGDRIACGVIERSADR
jgi:Cu-Zn family superoxide dismutase